MLRPITALLALALLATPVLAQDGAGESSAGSPYYKAIVGERVEFQTLDAATGKIDGYLFRPANPAPKAPAVVLMHGRAGIFSSTADGTFNASTISMRHKWWAKYWTDRGYYVLLADSFSQRGYPGGFAAGTYDERPKSIDEVNIRPLDAYGALKYLRGLPGVDGDRVGLMGWSNGGSAGLATMADDKPGDMRKHGFRAAVIFYPGCGMKKRFDKKGYKPYAPLLMFMGAADEEVSPETCSRLVERSKGLGGVIDYTLYPGVTHGFDDPGKKRQGVPANAAATADVRARIAPFFEKALAPR